MSANGEKRSSLEQKTLGDPATRLQPLLRIRQVHVRSWFEIGSQISAAQCQRAFERAILVVSWRCPRALPFSRKSRR